MRKLLIAGNWKMHKTLVDARELVSDLRARIHETDGVEVLICPPYTLLFPMAKAVDGSPIRLGAQNTHEEAKGAYTGEVSVPMIADTGAAYVIVGHSERRHVFGEGNDRLARKVRAVVDAGLVAIYCVGETLEEREAGRTEAVIDEQLSRVISREVPAQRLVIAYEPVWAIGTGKTATPEQAQEVHRQIRTFLAGVYGQGAADTLQILYGGSVKPGNADGLLRQPDIDGALVGGACLAAEEFAAIISAACEISRR